MKYYFSINLSSIEYLPYYQGKVNDIVVTAHTGERIQFPAMHLRKFITPSGVFGRFCMETQNNKFVGITKIS